MFFSRNLGGLAMRPRACRPGACLRGIVPESRRIFGGPATCPRSIVGRGGLVTFLYIFFLVSLLFGFLIPFPSFFRSAALYPFLGRSPSFLVFDRRSTFTGGRCSSARSLAGRRFSRKRVCRGRASEGSRWIQAGDALPRDRWPDLVRTPLIFILVSFLYLSL